MAAPVVAEVIPYRDESIDSLLKRLKKATLKAGLTGEFKRKAFHMKPSERKRFKRQRARNKLRKAMLRRAKLLEVKPFPSNGARHI